MGALTLKTFPFELRGWDIQNFESIDPTDGFGSSTRVYISKQQFIQIEPDHSNNTSKVWLTDKGRQFFDGIFGYWGNKSENNKDLVLKKESWRKNTKTLLKTLYLFEHCACKTKKTHFFTIVFENLGIETLSLLKVMEQNYSFLKVRRAENLSTSNDIEFNFQLNAVTNLSKIKSSTLCLLIGTNPRYEGSTLNLNLRQRYFKGNFKCLTLGSLVDLTFPSTFLGTSLKILTDIAEGNSFACQDFKAAKNPLLIFGNEFFKHMDSKNALEMLGTCKHTNVLNKNWNGVNILNSTLTETGIQSVANFAPLTSKDINELSSLYFINLTAQNIPNIKKIIETKLLKYTNVNISKYNIKELFFDQNSRIKNNKIFIQSFSRPTKSKEYNFLPVKMFYENEETFINTEGLIKRTSKLITKRKTREGWKLLRNLVKHFQNQYTSLNHKSNSILIFNGKKQSNFSSFTHFHYCAVEKLSSFTLPATPQNQPFFVWKTNVTFKQRPFKINNIKSKYWLDDFFTGGKDEYTRNSLVLSSCSQILRAQITNFF